MKKTLLLALLSLSFWAVKAQDKSVGITFQKLVHNFGKIPLKIPAVYEFTFTNSGSAPLIINSANTACRCVTTEYTKAPILYGQTGKIKVTYNAASAGAFVKEINVMSNATTNNGSTILTIQGEVN